MPIKLSQFYTLVAQHADTTAQGIDAADTSRVLAAAFKVMAGLSSTEVASVIAQGLARAADAKHYPAKSKR